MQLAFGRILHQSVQTGRCEVPLGRPQAAISCTRRSVFSRSELFTHRKQFLVALRGGFGISMSNPSSVSEDNLRDNQPSILLVVSWNDIPGNIGEHAVAPTHSSYAVIVLPEPPAPRRPPGQTCQSFPSSVDAVEREALARARPFERVRGRTRTYAGRQPRRRRASKSRIDRGHRSLPHGGFEPQSNPEGLRCGESTHARVRSAPLSRIG